VAGTASNVVVGEATLYIAPAGTVMPTAPATTGATAWATPSAPWVSPGFTESGVTLNVDRKTGEIRVEEQSTPVLITPDTTDVTIDITFAEDTVLNMQNAYGGGTITTVAAATGVPGTTTLALADSLTAVAVLFYGVNAKGYQRQVYIPSMVAAGKVKTEYMRMKSPRLYPTTFTATCALPSIIITDITAAAL
jgi:hypothetical protein